MTVTTNDPEGPRWLARLGRAEDAALRAERVFCVAALAVMTLAVMATVLIRNLNLPLPNYGEWALVSMVALTFIGGAMCTRLGAHIAIDAIQLVPSRIVRRVCGMVVALGIVAFAAIYLYSGIFVLAEALDTGERMLDLGTPVAVPVAFVPAGMALMLFHALAQLARLVAGVQIDEEPAR